MKKKIVFFKNKLEKLSINPFSMVKHPVFSGSVVMIVGSNFSNFIAYIYHLIFGRIMQPSEYGSLAASISLLGIFTVCFTFFGSVIVKFVSEVRKSETSKVIMWFVKKLTLPAILVGGFLILFSRYISSFFNIDNFVVVLIGIILSLSVYSLVLRSALQGLLKFRETVLLVNTEMIGRLIFGLIFFSLGLSIVGTFLGILLSVFLSLALSIYFLKPYNLFKFKGNFTNGKRVIKFAIPVFFASLCTNSFFTTDMLLVKHFFDPHDAGIYASISTLGKIIFFGAGPVSSVMFPMISKRHSQGLEYKKIFLMSLFLTTFISLTILSFYFFYPQLSIKLLYGQRYLEASSNLFPFGVFMTIFTVNSLLMNFFLSKSDTFVVSFAVIFSLFQVVGIWFYHATINSVIKVSIISALLFLLSLLIYLKYDLKRKESNKKR